MIRSFGDFVDLVCYTAGWVHFKVAPMSDVQDRRSRNNYTTAAILTAGQYSRLLEEKDFMAI